MATSPTQGAGWTGLTATVLPARSVGPPTPPHECETDLKNSLSGVIDLARASDTPIYLQIYQSLRSAILSGVLKPGACLPPSRQMARELGVSRKTVVTALECLDGEGLVKGRQGSGVRIIEWKEEIEGSRPAGAGRRSKRKAIRFSAVLGDLRRAKSFEYNDGQVALRPGIPDLRLFPANMWGRMLRHANQRQKPADRGYDCPSGHLLLKEALTGHLTEKRLAAVTPQQVVIASSAQGILDLIARLFIEPGDVVWHEEPGYHGARAAFTQAKAEIVPVPVDENGLNFEAYRDRTKPKLIYVTPSHQFPLGYTLSLARRQNLLDYAGRVGALVIEDDYDSELHYEGRPIAALQGLRDNAPVIYVGTLSKTMAPSLRVGFAVAPHDVAKMMAVLQRSTGQVASTDVQIATAEFIANGHYARHLRRLHKIYAERRAALINAIERRLGSQAVVHKPNGGMQLVIELPRAKISDTELVETLARLGVAADPLSRFYIGKPVHQGLMLGFASWTPDEIDSAVSKLQSVLEPSRPAGGSKTRRART